MKQTQKLIISIAILIVTVGSFSLGKSIGQKTSSQVNSSSQTVQSELFRSQTATFQGEITKVNKGFIEVKSDSGQAGSFALSSRVTIYKFTEGSKQASTSSDLNSIKIGKKVLIILELSGGQYKVVSITYQPPRSTLSLVKPQPQKSLKQNILRDWMRIKESPGVEVKAA